MTMLFAVIVLAFVLDALLGDPHGRFHPVALFGSAAAEVERFCRASAGDGVGSGLIGWLLMTGSTAAGAWALVRSLLAVHPCAGLFAAAGIVYLTIALRSLVSHAEAIRRPLLRGEPAAARRALSMIVSRDTAALGESEIVRGGIESLGENLIDAVNSAVFFAVLGFLFGGLPGAGGGACFRRCRGRRSSPGWVHPPAGHPYRTAW